jgi:hypothetical protein
MNHPLQCEIEKKTMKSSIGQVIQVTVIYDVLGVCFSFFVLLLLVTCRNPMEVRHQEVVVAAAEVNLVRNANARRPGRPARAYANVPRSATTHLLR